LTCTNSSICVTCDSATRNTADLSICSCLTGFYDNGISSSCLACSSTCLTCNNPNNCTTCPSNRVLTSLQTCICAARTFDPYCLSCDFSCLSCTSTSTTCTSCNGTAMRYLNTSTSQCLCYAGYYSDGAN
jgi:proprotein convertase subtilisin/kexin type 5